MTRTHDLLITNQLHYRLCYTSVLDFDNVSIIPDSFPFVNIIFQKKKNIFSFSRATLDFGTNVW